MSVHGSSSGADIRVENDVGSTASVTSSQRPQAVVLVCEHASNHIPPEFHSLGLTDAQLLSHIAWDPGAFAVAGYMRDQLGATLVESSVSRLVYDCNRPPDAPDAMPASSEIHTIPGNCHLTAADRQHRVDRYYRPFEQRVTAAIVEAKARDIPLSIVTIHSFTPVYRGQQRATQIGILHDSDARLADEMLRLAEHHTPLAVHRNEPYSPTDGVTHTLRRHGLANGLLNVMIEIRNDLIATDEQQQAMAAGLSGWLLDALSGVR